MKLWHIEQDQPAMVTETARYKVEAETLEQAIAMVESGKVEAFDFETHYGCDSPYPTTYEDSYEIKQENTP